MKHESRRIISSHVMLKILVESLLRQRLVPDRRSVIWWPICASRGARRNTKIRLSHRIVVLSLHVSERKKNYDKVTTLSYAHIFAWPKNISIQLIL
jgi:hypothetical protein